MTPICWPCSSMSRTSGTRILSLIRVWSRSGGRRSNLLGTGTSCGWRASSRWRARELLDVCQHAHPTNKSTSQRGFEPGLDEPLAPALAGLDHGPRAARHGVAAGRDPALDADDGAVLAQPHEVEREAHAER